MEQTQQTIIAELEKLLAKQKQCGSDYDSRALLYVLEHLNKGGSVLVKTGETNPTHTNAVNLVDPEVWVSPRSKPGKPKEPKKMYGYPYAMAQLTSDTVLIRRPKDGDALVLLIIRRDPPYQWFVATTGGFADIVHGESIDKSAKRELEEEVSNGSGRLHRCTFRADGQRDPRGYTATCVYVNYVSEDAGELAQYKPSDDAAGLAWFPISALNSALDGDSGPVLEFLKGELEDATRQQASKRIEVLTNALKNFASTGFAFDHGEILAEVLEKEKLRG